MASGHDEQIFAAVCYTIRQTVVGSAHWHTAFFGPVLLPPGQIRRMRREVYSALCRYDAYDEHDGNDEHYVPAHWQTAFSSARSHYGQTESDV